MRHALVPMGGICGGIIGVTDGGTIPQIVGGQIGRISIALEQSGSICPFTHSQAQLAWTGSAVVPMLNAIAAVPIKKRLILFLPFWRRVTDYAALGWVVGQSEIRRSLYGVVPLHRWPALQL
jgi:hypothetical protein